MTLPRDHARGKNENARAWLLSSVISPIVPLMTATFPFNAPPRHREMTRAANDFDMPKATIDIVTPVSPAMRTGLRPGELFGMSLKETCEIRKCLRELTDSIRQATPGKHGRESRQCEQRLDYACTA